MKSFGNEEIFSIKYTLIAKVDAILQVFINGQSVSAFMKGNAIYECRCNLKQLVEWLEQNDKYILAEQNYPLPINGDTGVELYNKSGEFDSEDDEKFDLWYKIRQDWYFTHSWYISRDNGYLPDLIFRRVNENIEISWDNTELYKDVAFVNPRGTYYVRAEVFERVINEFIKAYKLEFQKE